MSNPFFRPASVRQGGRFVARFAHQLSVRSGTQVGHRWNPTEPASASSSGWQIAWSDGPTVPLMRYFATGLAGSVAGVDVDQLQWRRQITAQSFALALIHNWQVGFPPLGVHPDHDSLLRALEEVDYPERASAREVELAGRLARLGNHLERDMESLLAEYGLECLEAPSTGHVRVARRLQDNTH